MTKTRSKAAAPRAPKRRMEPMYVKRRQRGLAVLIAALILLIGLTVWIGIQMTTNSFSGTGNEDEVELVYVEEGTSMSELGTDLEEKGVVKSQDSFASAAYQNPQAAHIEPGYYRMNKKMGSAEAVKWLLDPSNKVDQLQVNGGSTLLDVTVVAGDTRKGIFSQIAELTCGENDHGNCISSEQLQDVAANADPATLGVPEWAQAAVGERQGDPRRLEGLVKPGTYLVDPAMDAEDILTELVTRARDFYNSTNIEERAQAVNLTPYQLLTAASLIEREAPAGEFDKVARVILNRLDKDMQLEFDSTVNYGLAEQEVATTDEDRAKQTPWNTYAMRDLPATPIASPSDEAIHAIEHPADGDWLFFVTIDTDGTTVFNNTFEEHQRDVDRALDSGVLDTNR